MKNKISILYKKEKSCKKNLKQCFGKNNTGKITSRHKGGGEKILYRYIDYWFSNYGLGSNCGYVYSLHYDPNRRSYLALLGLTRGLFKGRKVYFIPPMKLRQGVFLTFGENLIYNIGHSKPIQYCPLGSIVYNIELYRGRGSTLVRSPGTSAKIVSFFKDKALIKLPSGIIKSVANNCFVSIGRVIEYKKFYNRFFKAGHTRNINKRPKVRGVAKNACDHPHGGGEGRSRVGTKYSKTPWGKPALGVKTKKKSLKYSIIKRSKK